MKLFKHKLVTIALLSVISGQAFAECNEPAAPIIPDGNVASMDELVSAQKAMKMYQTSLGTYRDCLKVMESEVDIEAEDAQERSATILESYNGSVDNEATIAEEFNSAVRAYKSRKPLYTAE